VGRVILGIGAVILAIILVAAIPSIREDTSEPCRALEKLAVAHALSTPHSAVEPYRVAMRQTIANTLQRERHMDGKTGRAAASRMHRNLPAYFGCALGYWDIAIWPERLDTWLAAMWGPG
jgi:hypothetical protein